MGWGGLDVVGKKERKLVKWEMAVVSKATRKLLGSSTDTNGGGVGGGCQCGNEHNETQRTKCAAKSG